MPKDETTVEAAVARTFVDGVDFYFENGLMVLTRQFLIGRGYCCENGCRHCPYGFVADASKQVDR